MARPAPHKQFELVTWWYKDQLGSKLGPAGIEAWARERLQELSELAAPNGDASLLLGWTRGLLHTHLAGALEGIPEKASQAPDEYLAGFRLRLAALECSTPPGDLPNDINRSASAVLKAPPANFDVPQFVIGLFQHAPYAAKVEPGGRWRAEWGLRIKAALDLPSVSPALRSAFVRSAIHALFPTPPPRPWTVDEEKSLKLLTDLLVGDKKPLWFLSLITSLALW